MTLQETIAGRAAGLFAIFSRVQAELKANRRAALGLLVLCCLVAGYGLLSFQDSLDGLRAQYAEASQRLDRLHAAGTEQDWPARAVASEQARQLLQAQLWRADGEGIALANLQDWVTHEGRDAGLDKLQVKVEPVKTKGLPNDLLKVTATITALDSEASLIAFLGRIKREPRLLIVEHLQVREKPVNSMEMTLVAYTRVDSHGPPAK